MEQSLTKKQGLVQEGRCPECGEFSYPYYHCQTHRYLANIRRVLLKMEKNGWVDVERDSNDKRVKIFKWNNTAPISRKDKKFSPETIAKWSLPRLKGKPLTDKLIGDCIIKVLEENGHPMTEDDIQRGFKGMKTIGKVIPDTELLIKEYKMIKQKKSSLSKNQRDAVEYKINFLLQRGVIQKSKLTNAT